VSTMKSVPNLISYLHEFSWNFSQFLAVCFELLSLRSVFILEIADVWDPPVSLPLSAPGPPVCAPSPHGCHAPTPCLKGTVGAARIRPDSRPHPDHAPPPTAAVRSHTAIHSRPCVSDAPRHRHRPATPAVSAPVTAKPRVPAPSSRPRRPNAAVIDSAGKPWCRRLRRTVMPYSRRHLYHKLAP
jgi:hypothetical protein